MSAYDNPAEQLHTVLQKLAQVHASTGTVGQAWSQALETDETHELTYRFGVVLTLPQKIEDTLRQLATFHEYMMLWRTGINEVLTNSGFGRPWGNVKALLQPTDISGVSMCARQISVIFPGYEVLPEETRGYISELQDILADVRKAELEPNLKNFIEWKIRRLIDRMERAEVEGSAPVSDEVKRDITDFYFDPTLNAAVRKSKPVGRFWDFLNKASITYTLFTAPIQLHQYIQPLLPDSSQVKAIEQKAGEHAQPDPPIAALAYPPKMLEEEEDSDDN